MDMPKPKDKQTPEAIRERYKRYRVLSHELLRFANLRLLRTEFLPRVSEKILEFSEAHAVELWVKDGETRHYRCSVTEETKMPFGAILVPCPLGEEADSYVEGSEQGGMERLCCNIVKGRYDLSPLSVQEPFGTGGETDRKEAADILTLEHEAGGEGLGLESEYASRAFIRIGIDEECMGLLLLKSREKEFFHSEDLAFYGSISEILAIALVHQYTQIELRERLKELTCLYGIAQVMAHRDKSFGDILQEIVKLLPPAWLHTDVACARITLDGKACATGNFRESPFHQRADVIVNNQCVGSVEVAYLEKRLTLDEGPFMAEERNLINSVAREVAHFYERTQADEEKASLHGQLRHADRLATIGQLAAGVAHELNEPLGNILGFAQLAMKTPEIQPQVEKDLQSIENASLHAREIIKKLMTFARQLPADQVRTNINKIVKEGLYFFEARCVKAGIRLELRLAPDLPPVWVDPGQMNQVLVNLVVNAIQAMPEGGTITVATLAEKDHVFLSVEDTGEGMSEKVQRQIFLPFFTTKDINEGTGLGLPVVHGIVTSHKGIITVESKAGKGSCFTIQLPASDAEDQGSERRS
jgi:signal transduction histidine kinase